MKSFNEARNLANSAETTSTNGVTVWMRGGWYTQSTTFTFNSTDGGSAGKPIIWRAYPGESVVIAGASQINSSKWTVYSGPTSRLNPAVTASDIYQCNLSDLNLAVSGTIPAVINDNDNNFIQNTNLPGLYCNGARQALAKFPKTGFMEVLTVDNAGSSSTSGVITYKTSPSQLYVSTNSIGRNSAWVGAVPHGAWLKGYWRVGWQNTTLQILSIDTSNNTITLAPFGTLGNAFGHGHEPYYIINLLEEISQPGDWCVDSLDQKVYFYPPGTISSSNLRISDNVNPMFTVNGASYLEFIGLEVVNNRGSAFKFTNCSNDQINGCMIHDIDEDAVVIAGGSNCGVSSSNLYNLGAQGVSLLAAGSATSNCGHYVSNCHIYNFGVLNNIYAGAVNAGYKQVANYGSTVNNNLVHDSPHVGILFGGSNSLFQANDVFRICEATNDMGTFYSFITQNTYGANAFYYNFSHNAPYGDGIYFDAFGLGDIVSNNVSYQMDRGFLYHNSWPNATCTNNISYDNNYGWSNIYPGSPGANVANNVAAANTTQNYVLGNGTLAASNLSYTSATNLDFTSTSNLEFSLLPGSPVFTSDPNFVNFPSGSRLGLVSGGTSNGTQADIQTDDGTTNKRWVATLQSDGSFELAPENAPNSRLDVNGKGTANGTKVQIWAQNNGTNQKWNLIDASGNNVTSIANGGVYQLAPENAPTSRLDVYDGGSADGTVVDLWQATATSNQQWQTLLQSDGSYELVPENAAGPGIYTDSYRIALPTRSSINYAVNPPVSGAQF